MRGKHPRQRVVLTRAIRRGDLANPIEVIARTVRGWDDIGACPDDWATWQSHHDVVRPLSHGHVVFLAAALRPVLNCVP